MQFATLSHTLLHPFVPKLFSCWKITVAIPAARVMNESGKFLFWAILIVGCSTNGLFATDSFLPARVLKHVCAEGKTVEAVVLQLKQADQAGIVQHDHLIFVDTSASQVGAHRLHSLAILESMLAGLPDTDRVQLFAIDVQAEPLMSSFAQVHSNDVRQGVTTLKGRIPLGATNLQAVIQTALKAKAADRDCSIVYIGDGMSTADLLEPTELRRLVTSLRQQKIPFHSFGIGPKINLELLGILALQTGGFIDFDKRIGAGEDRDGQSQISAKRGGDFAQALGRPVVFPSQVKISTLAESLPLLPFRADRETVHVITEALSADAELSVVTDGSDSPLSCSLSAAVEQPGLSYLAAIARQMEHDAGLGNPLAGRAVMQQCQRGFTDSLKEALQFGNEQLNQGKFEAADQIARTVTEIDPTNTDAESLGAASRKARVLQISRKLQTADPVDVESRTLPDADASLTRNVEQLIRVKTEKLRNQVSNAISLSKSDEPESGLVRLKQARNSVLLSTDIAPEDRAQLMKRLDSEIAQARSLKDKVDQERVHLAERLSQLESEKRLTEQFLLDEEKLEGLIERVRALMLEGKHGRDEAYGEAQNVADVAINLRPGEGTSSAARFDSEAAQQLNRAYRLRARRADQLLETLHQVELSHIPFPDEPPVRYPPAEVWKALSQRRKQWASVDLHRSSPREKKIQEELKNTTEVNFTDIPLKDALDYLEELHHIEIWPDTKLLSEEGISTDTTVTLVMSGITLRSVLRLLLEPLLLTYVIEDEVLKITTETAASEKMVTRVYPVADLVVPIMSPQMGGGGMGGQRGGMGGGMGGMGGGMGGMGGGMGMGMGMGGGFFSIPPEPAPLKLKFN